MKTTNAAMLKAGSTVNLSVIRSMGVATTSSEKTKIFRKVPINLELFLELLHVYNHHSSNNSKRTVSGFK